MASYNGKAMDLEQRITIALVDKSGDSEATPERVRLAALADFTRDVQEFLRGSDKEIDPATLEVAIKAGSVAIETAPLIPELKVFRDLQALRSSELLDRLDHRRKDIIERWQKAAKGIRKLSYRITAPSLDRPIWVSSDTDFRSDDADQWVDVERYVQGVVVDLGGSTKPNAHIRLPDGRMLTVATEQQVLRDEKANRLYKNTMLRIRAKYNVLTRELRDARLVQFVEYAPSFDEVAFERLTRKGAVAWDGVEDASKWVDDMRGGDD